MSHPSSLSDAELYAAIQSSTHTKAQEAISFIIECVHQYGFDNVALSFNGGKDCTVLLHLFRAALYAMNQKHENHKENNDQNNSENHTNQPVYSISRLQIIYFHEPHEFPEIQHFMHRTATQFHISLTELRGSFITGLTDFLSKSSVRAIFMGQRNSDPFCAKIELIERSDTHRGWPAFDRVNPLLEWDYKEIWAFLRGFQCDYCELYEMGYTSLGNTENSVRNPALLDEKTGLYRPAYLLEDETLERAGRIKKSEMQKTIETIKGEQVNGSAKTCQDHLDENTNSSDNTTNAIPPEGKTAASITSHTDSASMNGHASIHTNGIDAIPSS